MVTEALRASLESLRSYMGRMYPERAGEFLLEFWKIKDDMLYLEALGYLPLHMNVTDSGEVPHLHAMPEGYRLAFPIFWLEDDYQFNGWTALTNAGEWLLPSACEAYKRVGLASEARALEAALASCRADPEDTDAAEAAYKSVENETRDDERRAEALNSFFVKNRGLFDCSL
jgi:hypothetical protein